MQTQVYVEQVLIDNFLLTYILLLTSYHLIKYNYSKLSLVLASTFSCILALVFPLVNVFGVWLVIFKLCCGYIIIFIAGAKLQFKRQIKLYLSFLFATAFYAGVYFALNYALFNSFDVNFVPIGFFACIIFILAKITLKTLKKYSSPWFCDNVFDFELIIKNKKLKFSAFLDTGNMLFDNITGLPIIIVEFNTISQILNKKEKLCLLSCSKTCLMFDGLHYTSYACLKGEEKLITFKPCAVYIFYKGKKTKVDCMVGVSTNRLFTCSNYQAIFGQSVLAF